MILLPGSRLPPAPGNPGGPAPEYRKPITYAMRTVCRGCQARATRARHCREKGGCPHDLDRLLRILRKLDHRRRSPRAAFGIGGMPLLGSDSPVTRVRTQLALTHCHHAHRDEPRRRPFLQPAREGGAVIQGGQSRHPLDPALLPPVSGPRGTVASRRPRLHPRQSPAPTGPPPGHSEGVADESPAAAVQDGWASDTTSPVLCPPAGREPLDTPALQTDPRPHRATCVADDLITGVAHKGEE